MDVNALSYALICGSHYVTSCVNELIVQFLATYL